MATQPTKSVLQQNESTSLQIITNRDNVFEYELQQVVDNQYVPIDLTGYSFFGSVYTTASNSVIIASFTFVIDADPTTGKVTATLSDADSALLDSSCEYAYEMYYNDSLGNKTDLVYGPVLLSTRSL